jgi:hypothetical protein
VGQIPVGDEILITILGLNKSLFSKEWAFYLIFLISEDHSYGILENKKWKASGSDY